MALNAQMPNRVILDDEEINRINRVRIAELLHKFPHEVDAAPARDIYDILEVKHGDELIAEFNKNKKKP